MFTVGTSQGAQAQTIVYKQTFNALPQGLWAKNVDQAKIKAHPENAGVTGNCGPDGSNCFRVVYRQADGIHKAPPSSPVFDTSTGAIDWAASDSTHTNTATDVTQDNLKIDGTTNDLGNNNDAAVPGKAYTLSYDVYFEPGFDFAKGGKLPGLAAAAFDSGCTEDGNAKRSGTNWSVRLMWRANGRVELYSYDQTRPSGSCGIDKMIDQQAGDAPYEVPGQIPVDDKFRFKPGVWYTITLGVQVNSNDSVVYQKDANGNFVLDGLGDPVPVSGNGAEYLHIVSADRSVERTLVYANVPLRDECNGTCPAKVPDSPATWINGVFFSTFFGGNETKRTTCLSTTPPSFPGLTQAIFDKLCTSQRVSYIFPALTWNPQVPSAARFDNFTVVSGYPATGGDTTPPSIPGSLSATAVSSSQVNLLWVASSDNVGVAGYRVYRGTTLVGSPVGTTFSDTGLAPSTSYSYTVKAIDAAGNLSAASAAKSVTTPAKVVPDTTPPSVPAHLTATATSNSSIRLDWSAATDNVAVIGYRVFRGTTPLATPTATTFVDTGLSPATAYAYTVQAVDGAGNVSAASTAATATTLAASGGATPTTLSATDDATVREGASSNDGKDASLFVKSQSGANRVAYLKFDLGSIKAVTSAVLRVYGSSSAATMLTASATTDGWSNDTIVWTNAPAVGAALGSAPMTTTAKYVEIDVTAYVKAQAAGDQKASFVLNESAGKYTTLNSSDNAANRPQLVVK